MVPSSWMSGWGRLVELQSSPASGLLERAQERVLVRARELVDLGNLRFGYFASKNATYAFPARMHVEHYLGGPLAVHIEESLQHHHYKVHRCEVIVQQHDLVQGRALDFGAGFFHHQAM